LNDQEGYVSWAEYERNQTLLAGDATGGLATRSPDGVDARCWLVSSAARAAVVGSAFSTPVAIRGRSTGANSRTCSWVSGVA